MNRRCRQLLAAALFMLMITLSFSSAAFASDDNSLASLGIKTEGVSVSPEFRYDIWEYSVEVPAGTQTLELEPHTTNPSATVNSVTGTTLSADGTGTVVINVTSESGNAIEYVLNVTSARGDVDPAEAIAANESAVAATIDTEVVQSEVETEDPRYVKVDRNSLQDAENTIEKLQKTITEQRSHISMLTYVLYALIAVSIIFLFIVISLLLRRRDMAQELAFYRESGSFGGTGSVADDGWGDWGDDDPDRARGRKKKKNTDYDEWGDDPQDSAVSWTSRQVGTPVRPQNHPSRNVRPADAQPGNAGFAAAQPRNPRQAQGTRQTQAPRQMQSPDETRRYEAVQPVHPQEVPRDVTKDLTRVNKAEAKAMKKAAAAQAKLESEARKAGRARAEEARRQAQEAQRIEKEQEAARQAQEKALNEAAARRELNGAGPDADSGDKGKNVKIDMVDL